MQFLLLMFFLKMARTSTAAARTIKMQRIIFVYLTWNFSTKSHKKKQKQKQNNCFWSLKENELPL